MSVPTVFTLHKEEDKTQMCLMSFSCIKPLHASRSEEEWLLECVIPVSMYVKRGPMNSVFIIMCFSK